MPGRLADPRQLRLVAERHLDPAVEAIERKRRGGRFAARRAEREQPLAVQVHPVATPELRPGIFRPWREGQPGIARACPRPQIATLPNSTGTLEWVPPVPRRPKSGGIKMLSTSAKRGLILALGAFLAFACAPGASGGGNAPSGGKIGGTVHVLA